jgi:hypothetical protein
MLQDGISHLQRLLRQDGVTGSVKLDHPNALRESLQQHLRALCRGSVVQRLQDQHWRVAATAPL